MTRGRFFRRSIGFAAAITGVAALPEFSTAPKTLVLNNYAPIGSQRALEDRIVEWKLGALARKSMREQAAQSLERMKAGA